MKIDNDFIRQVPDYPNYFSDIKEGLVYSKKPYGLRKMSSKKLKTGYYTVTLYKNGVGKSTSIHRVIMASFLGTWEWDKPEVDHIDHDRGNNRIGNLRLATIKEQMNDKVKSRLSKSLKGKSNYNKDKLSAANRGDKNNKAKLTSQNILDIRKRFESTDKKIKSKFVKEMSAEFNVSDSTIYRIISNKLWKHI